MNELTIFIFDAEEGMELSRDVILNDGSVLLTKGTILNLDLISRISGHHILEISVYDKTKTDSATDNRTISRISAVDEAKEAAKAADDENTKYYETVRNSEEFKTFEEHYNEHIDNFKDDLKKLISSDDEVDTKSLVKNTIDIVAESNNSLQLFDMLHAMRDVDDLTYVHSMNVALIASVIGKWMGYNQEKIKVLTLAGLMHDIGKPCCSSTDQNGIIHFYGHHRESCKIAVDLMHRLRMDNDTIREVSILVENHDVRVEPSLPAVKRMMARTGEVLFEKLLILQTADNMAKNLEHFPEKKNRIDASMQIYKQILAERQPYLVSHLAVNGKELIRLGYRPGREIGDVLRKLIDEVIIDANLNNRDYLLKEARILKKSNSKNGSQR